MSSSGKSSNRRSEENRGYDTGTGHGIYAAEGIRARAEEKVRAEERAQLQMLLTRSTTPRVPAPKPLQSLWSILMGRKS